MMIAVAIAGSLVYAWVMGYIGSSAEKEGKAIAIQSVANLDNDLLVFVKNVGEEMVQLEETSCLYVDGLLVPCTISDVATSDGVATLNEGETATLTFVDGAALPGEKITVKVTTSSAISADYSGYPAENTKIPSVLDHFDFTTVESPQISGKPFNVTVKAMDQCNRLFTSYTGVNTLSYSGGTINSTLTGRFTNGVWTGTVTVTGPETSATITTTAQSNSSKNGTSNLFEVVPIEPATLWNQTYGDRSYFTPHTRDEVPYALVETSDGGFALAGESTEPENFDVYLVGWFVKTDEFGNMEWNKTYTGIIRSLIETSDGGYIIAGYLEGVSNVDDDFWLAKTDNYGNIEWSKTYGGSDLDKTYGGPDRERAYSMVETPDGGYALAGEDSVGTISRVDDFTIGFNDFWLVKTDAYGNMEWNKTYGGPVDNERAISLAVTPDGGFAIAGTKEVYDLEREPDERGYIPNNGTLFWLVKTDAYGNVEWNQTYGGTDLIYTSKLHCLSATSDGGYILGGDTNKFNAQQFRMWIVKVDENGVEEWNRTYREAALARAHPTYEYANSVVETPDGGYLIAGTTGGLSLLMKTNSTGHMEWNQTYDNGRGEAPTVLVATSDGGCAVAGSSIHYVHDPFGGEHTGYDFWLIKTNENGIIPEFSSWIILPFLLLTALIVVIFKKRVKF